LIESPAQPLRESREGSPGAHAHPIERVPAPRGPIDGRSSTRSCEPCPEYPWFTSLHFSSPAAAAALTISPAAVAAVPPPYPPFSTSTANAIRLVAGPYGANPTNQLWDGLPDSSAVPVFPAIRQG